MRRNVAIALLKCIKNYNGKYYFSETGEDAVLSQVFKESKGKYLDIGAQHPIFGSNTFFFYRKGWSGIAIEPQNQFNILWKIFRKRDRLLNLLVGDSNELLHFAEFENPLISSADQVTISKHILRGEKPNYKRIKAVKLSSILAKKIEPDEPFFISIDVEGMEFEVLNTINFPQQQPRAILVENWSAPWVKKSAASLFIESSGLYELFAHTGLTSVYVHKSYMLKINKLRNYLSE